MNDDDVVDKVRAIAGVVLPGIGPPSVQRMERGGSTPVYRLQRDETTLYLRLAEGPAANLAPEVRVHERLRSLGVRAPEVVHFEPCNEQLQRSVMVTTEIPGESLSANHPGADAGAVLEVAGRDLAIINGIAVEGFGWIRRDRPSFDRLEAELPNLRAFALGEFESHLACLSSFLSTSDVNAIEETVARTNELFDDGPAVLAHGDFDVTHIYHRNGEYTGIIDFGEIRGTDWCYDLGHFALHDVETIADSLLPSLLNGYRTIAMLPPSRDRHIHLWSLLIGVRALARSIDRPHGPYQRHLVMAVRRALTALRL